MNVLQPNHPAGPVAAAGVSCVIGFDLHAFLGYAGQIVGLISGIVSVSWVLYQMYRSYQNSKAPPK
jgi:hypothetical protein